MSWVIDASVAIKWFVEEQRSQAAKAVLAKAELLIAPDLIIAETSNTAWKKVKKGEMTAKQGEAMVRALPLYFDRLVSSADLVGRAYALANQLDHPLYDCLYLALAETEAVDLITDDERLCSAATRMAAAGRVRLLTKFEGSMR